MEGALLTTQGRDEALAGRPRLKASLFQASSVPFEAAPTASAPADGGRGAEHHVGHREPGLLHQVAAFLVGKRLARSSVHGVLGLGWGGTVGAVVCTGSLAQAETRSSSRRGRGPQKTEENQKRKQLKIN